MELGFDRENIVAAIVPHPICSLTAAADRFSFAIGKIGSYISTRNQKCYYFWEETVGERSLRCER